MDIDYNLYGTYSPWYYKINGQLVKKKKPCLPDQYVHVHKWQGAYRVYDVTVEHFVIKKNREFVNLPWSEFRCLKGQGTSIDARLKKSAKSIERLSEQLIAEIKKSKSIVHIGLPPRED
jgi:hypothetical protein